MRSAILLLELTATDSAGLSHTQSVLLDPRTVDLTLASSPGGLTLGFDASQAKASFARRVIVGSRHSISAAATQPEPGKKSYVFQSCSDGRAPSHDIVAPAANTTYTAVYKRSR